MTGWVLAIRQDEGISKKTLSEAGGISMQSADSTLGRHDLPWTETAVEVKIQSTETYINSNQYGKTAW